MTRKDYVKTASNIKARFEQSKEAQVLGSKQYFIGLATDMADMFASDNPRFDRTRFMDACGFDGETR